MSEQITEAVTEVISMSLYESLMEASADEWRRWEFMTDAAKEKYRAEGARIVAEAISPAMRDLLAEAWDEGYNGGFQNGAEAARREPVSRANNPHSRAVSQVDASWCCCDVMPMRDCPVHGEEADR